MKDFQNQAIMDLVGDDYMNPSHPYPLPITLVTINVA